MPRYEPRTIVFPPNDVPQIDAGRKAVNESGGKSSGSASDFVKRSVKLKVLTLVPSRCGFSEDHPPKIRRSLRSYSERTKPLMSVREPSPVFCHAVFCERRQ